MAAAAEDNPIHTLLGDKLLQSDGSEADISQFNLSDCDAIGLYFSAHWCGPCRGFTPQLAKSYTRMKDAGKKFEIVFVSSDQNQDAFNEYFGEMPWLGLPYADRDLKAKLSKKYKVRGIPTLVILDAKTGKVITTDGRSAIGTDPAGDNFPWTPKSFWDIMDNGTDIRTKDGTIKPADLKSKEVIGLYFSAHWCPPCRQFTPKLAETYKKITGAGKSFEIVFVSGDQKEAEFDEYYATHPWATLPFQDKRCDELNSTYKVRGIPSLVIVDSETGKTINDKGRMAVGGDPDGAEFPWKPKPMNELTGNTAGNINDVAAMILFVNDGSDEHALKAALQPVAEEQQAAQDAGTDDTEIEFFYAKEDPLVGRIRGLLGDKLKTEHCAVILNVPEGVISLNGVKATDVTSDFLRRYLADFKSGKLDTVPLR